MAKYFDEPQPSRDEVDRWGGAVLLEFGAQWCEHCQALAPILAALVERHPHVQHVKIEDGKGRPLGRSFQVKLWPTLVFIRNGSVLRQLARPTGAEIEQSLAALAGDEPAST